MTDETIAPWARQAMAEHDAAERAERVRSADRERQVLDRIDTARRRKPKVREERITSAHGAGGKATQTLVEAVFLEAFRNPMLAPLGDAAELTVDGARLAMTTDSYVVSPLFFPGGNIGDLAVNGTVNDLAVSGATPLYLSCGFILEEGFPVTDLRRIVVSMTAAARAAGVSLVTGDTKVVGRGKGDGCYLNTTGVGALDPGVRLGIDTARPGDAILVSGPVGEHGVTIMLARGELDIDADLTSDTAPLHEVCRRLMAVPGVRAMRDATRGGVATILNEIARAADVSVVVDESAVPVRDQVRGASELLGIDPLYVACEGRFVAVVDGDRAGEALAALRADPLGRDAAVIGHVGADPRGLVLLKTAFGGTRIMDLLVGDPLPGSAERVLMHELSLTQSIVETIAERLGDRPVTRVRLEIGQVSGVLVDAVRFCFDVVAQGTTLEGAVLEIEEPAGIGRCRACGATIALPDLLTQCPCDSVDIEVLSGHQLRIREVEAGRDVRNLRV